MAVQVQVQLQVPLEVGEVLETGSVAAVGEVADELPNLRTDEARATDTNAGEERYW